MHFCLDICAAPLEAEGGARLKSAITSCLKREQKWRISPGYREVRTFGKTPPNGFRVFFAERHDLLATSDISPPYLFRVAWCSPLDVSVLGGPGLISPFYSCVQNASCAKDWGKRRVSRAINRYETAQTMQSVLSYKTFTGFGNIPRRGKGTRDTRKTSP